MPGNTPLVSDTQDCGVTEQAKYRSLFYGVLLFYSVLLWQFYCLFVGVFANLGPTLTLPWKQETRRKMNGMEIQQLDENRLKVSGEVDL